MSDEDIAKAIHYPGCWDTMAYPTLACALWEMVGPLGDCPSCGKPQDVAGKAADLGEEAYGCGHVGDTVILDSNALSFAAYLEWKDSFGFGGDRSLCFPCFCRRMREDSR